MDAGFATPTPPAIPAFRGPVNQAGLRTGGVAGRSIVGPVRRALERLLRRHPKLLSECIRKGLEAPPPKSAPYLQLAALYLDGRPRDVDDGPRTLIQINMPGAGGTVLPPDIEAKVLLSASNTNVSLGKTPESDNARSVTLADDPKP